jgi:hypothetical protein
MADDSPTIRIPTPATPGGQPPTGDGAPPPGVPPAGSPPPPGGPGGRRRLPLSAIVAIAVVGAILVVTWRPMIPPSSTPSPSGSAAVVDTPSPTTSSTETATTEPTPSVSVSPTPTPPPPRPVDEFLLMPKATFMALPTSGRAWEALRFVADEPAGLPDLRDQDDRHGVITLASALVYARTGDTAYAERARSQIMAAIGTEQVGADNSILSLGRQLGAYVLAADFIGLSGPDDQRFRDWLTTIRTRELGGHGRWRSLVDTHEDAPNNWGSFTGASRIAASLYLQDMEDVARAAQVLRGFLGDRDAYAGFQDVEGARSWACEPERYTPVNPPCIRGGIDLDGAIVRDIDRGGNRKWPPGRDGIGYTLESLQGLTLQAELLTVNGFGDAWSWSDQALRRAADVVTRSGAAGGTTWNRSDVSYHVPWLLNARYGLDLPTEPAGFGRVFGYTDWLYGT